MNIDELLKTMVNKEYDELKAIAQTAVTRIIPPLKEIVGEDTAFGALVVFITTCVAADGNLTVNEKRLMNDVMGVAPENAKDVVQKGYDYDFTDKFFDSCSDDMKKDLLLLCVAFFAIDESICKEETALLRRLIS